MRPLSTKLPNFAEAMLLSLADLRRFEPFWFSDWPEGSVTGDSFDDAMMDFGTLLDAPEGS